MSWKSFTMLVHSGGLYVTTGVRRSPLQRPSIVICLIILLLASGLLNSYVAPVAHAAPLTTLKNTPPTNTFAQFLQQRQPQSTTFLFPPHASAHTSQVTASIAGKVSQLPSAEPAKMKPIVAHLTAAASSSQAATPVTSSPALDLKGSDGRLEMIIPAGALDFSHATLLAGGAPAQPLSIQVIQKFGHYPAQVSLLGAYTVSIVDAQGQPVTGVRVLHSITYQYHYQPGELELFGFDPGHIYLAWPDQIMAASKADASADTISAATTTFTNDPHTQTLSAQSMLLNAGTATVGSISDNQQPPQPKLAETQGNAGQLAYSIPIAVPNGPAGTTPQLSLSYSSQSTNLRRSMISPTSATGEGWSISLGSVSVEEYPSSSAQAGTWYNLGGAGVNDRLLPNPGDSSDFVTQHISHYRIHLFTPSGGQPCWHVWDDHGNYNEFGCTSDSLQYFTDSNGTRHNYRWDLNLTQPADDGYGGRYLKVSYLQDKTSQGVRDAAIKQITYGSDSGVAGTVDFFYKAPFALSGWTQQYGTNDNCDSAPPVSTTLRCDDPLSFPGGIPAGATMSTFSLQTITSYTGDDSSSSHRAFGYHLSYQDIPFGHAWDDLTQLQEYAAGSHLLTSVKPTVYKSDGGHDLKPVQFSYTTRGNSYNDFTSGHTDAKGNPYNQQTWWRYLTQYIDLSTGSGESITYMTAHSNAHGTPYDAATGDDRYDPFYCDTHSDCTGSFYGHNDDMHWDVQAVSRITVMGTDTSSNTVPKATTTFHYRLAFSHVSSATCPTDSNHDSDCVTDVWAPSGDKDWQDFYHQEFRGFSHVYITTPAGNLIDQHYAVSDGWGSPQGNSANYVAGSLYDEEDYQGSTTSSPLLRKVENTYLGAGPTATNACLGNYSGIYTPCIVLVNTSKTTFYEGTTASNAPWILTTNTYDGYSTTSGLDGSKPQNLISQQISSSNAPTITNTFTYQVTDAKNATGIFYNLRSVVHSQTTDANGHVWQCQDMTYDEGAASGVVTPDAGLVTTQKVYPNCANPATAITSYTGYGAHATTVATIDPFAAVNPGIYSTNGCTLADAPKLLSPNWTAGRFTSCTVFDKPGLARPVTTTNVLGQTTTMSYDYSQGGVLISAVDPNGQTTGTAYNYNNGSRTTSITQPGETGSFTSQSTTNPSNCGSSSTLPCFEVDSVTSQYASVTTRTFYDAQDRKVETRTPGPIAGQDTIVFTVYDDSTNSVFQSLPFVVASGTNWLDPNGALDINGKAPGGTTTYMDALGRTIAIRDPLYGSSTEPGIACSTRLTGTYTACKNYGLGTIAGGDGTIYRYTQAIDANNHMAVNFDDAMERSVAAQSYSGHSALDPASFGSNVTTQVITQYNALNKATSVQVKDLAPQSGQTITSVTTTATYDDMGRLTSISDPDRGLHTYTYDADSRLLTDVSGSRTLGMSYDLLGRVRCIQNATPTTDGSGACSSGSQPLVQDTYDTTTLGTQGSSDFPIGQLTQSVATTVYPDGSTVTTTERAQHDQRGRLTSSTLQLVLPGSWNVTTALPSYQENLTYNDANQLATTQTTIGGQAGYTFTQAYNSTTGQLTGLSNNTLGVANLATLGYDATGHVSDINFQTTTGTALANDHFAYDGNLRPASASATWQSGSGASGTIFIQDRSYDLVGNVASISTTLAAVPGQSSSGGSDTQNFCYDEQNRLVWAGNSGTQPAAGNGTCGSATLSSGLSGAGYSARYAYTNLGQLWQGPLNSVGGYQYLYCDSTHPHQLSGLYPTGTSCGTLSGAVYTSNNDAWGNVTARTYNSTTATLSYNQLDRLVQWNAGASSQEWYAYTAKGSRTLKRSTMGNGTTITVYAFGLEEHVYSGSGVPQNSTYYYTLAGRLLGELQGNTTQFFLTDALGSVLTTFNAIAGSAAIQGNRAYGPYGNSRYSKGAMGTSKGFTGQYADATGLDYYNARYYDPVIGRFLSADVKQGNMQGMDPYSYVAGNPETLTDPTGERMVGDDGSWANIQPVSSNTNTTTWALYVYTPPTASSRGEVTQVRSWTAPTQPQVDYQKIRKAQQAQSDKQKLLKYWHNQEKRLAALMGAIGDVANIIADLVTMAADIGTTWALVILDALRLAGHIGQLVVDILTASGRSLPPALVAFVKIFNDVLSVLNGIKSVVSWFSPGGWLGSIVKQFINQQRSLLPMVTKFIFRGIGLTFNTMLRADETTNFQNEEYKITHGYYSDDQIISMCSAALGAAAC